MNIFESLWVMSSLSSFILAPLPFWYQNLGFPTSLCRVWVFGDRNIKEISKFWQGKLHHVSWFRNSTFWTSSCQTNTTSRFNTLRRGNLQIFAFVKHPRRLYAPHVPAARDCTRLHAHHEPTCLHAPHVLTTRDCTRLHAHYTPSCVNFLKKTTMSKSSLLRSCHMSTGHVNNNLRLDAFSPRHHHVDVTSPNLSPLRTCRVSLHPVSYQFRILELFRFFSQNFRRRLPKRNQNTITNATACGDC